MMKGASLFGRYWSCWDFSIILHARPPLGSRGLSCDVKGAGRSRRYCSTILAGNLVLRQARWRERADPGGTAVPALLGISCWGRRDRTLDPTGTAVPGQPVAKAVTHPSVFLGISRGFLREPDLPQHENSDFKLISSSACRIAGNSGSPGKPAGNRLSLTLVGNLARFLVLRQAWSGPLPTCRYICSLQNSNIGDPALVYSFFKRFLARLTFVRSFFV